MEVVTTTTNMNGHDTSMSVFSLTLGKYDQGSLGQTFGNPDVGDDRLDPITFHCVASLLPVHLIGSQMSKSVTNVDLNGLCLIAFFTPFL